ncbi:MAG: class I SAM-dependent methyltransferase [Sulfitobacter sp.]|nr:class I SAM-dependent methyltransferase [Sulfitobacter sp.]MDG1351850.1 class I SAM-dependent methyltransferase [Sulfitobacter sp.]
MDNETFWDKAAPKYAKDPISDMDGYNQTLDRMRVLLKSHHKVLEIGCGTGSTALQLANGVSRYIGTDISPQMIAIAQSKLDATSPAQLSFAAQDAARLPEGPHDVILALNLLHLLPDLETVLQQIYDALPSGGLLIAKTGLLKDGLWLIPLIIPLLKAIGKAPYVRKLSAVEMLDLLKETGFVIDEQLTQAGVVPRIFTVARKP